jgi:GMP synthase (glutamine-hydrolysing)
MTEYRVPTLPFFMALLALSVCLALAVMAILFPRERELRGLLVDLELRAPDPATHRELRDTLTRELQAEVPTVRSLKVSLGYLHFSQFTREAVFSENADFLVLSPQGTPWHKYEKEVSRELDSAKQTLRDLVTNDNIPVLGICGGHQFMALAFGGTVGFIDPGLAGTFPERYPKNAISERGLVSLTTLGDDPILEGVARHPGTFRVMESHYEEIKSIPRQFINLARSDLSETQLMRIPGKPVYGLAFHPERSATDEAMEPRLFEGKRILANFLNMVVENRAMKH